MAAQNWNLDQIELHNFAGAEEAAEFHGIALHRFPKNMRRILRADSPICGEIRFVTDAPEVHIFLGFLNSTVKQTPIRVFQGNFERELPAGFSLDNGKVTELVLSAKNMLDRMNFEEMHTQTVLASMRPDALPKGGFSPKVWRIQFDQTPRVYFCGLDTGGVSRPETASGGEAEIQVSQSQRIGGAVRAGCLQRNRGAETRA